MNTISFKQFFNPTGHVDIYNGVVQDLSNFQNHINEANKIMEEIRLQNLHNAEVLKQANEILNNPEAVKHMQKIVEQSSTPLVQNVPAKEMSWLEKFLNNGHVGAEGVTGVGNSSNGVLGDGLESIKNSLQSIGKFTDGVMWIVEHPYETFKIIMGGLCNFVEIAAIVVCAGALLMAIFGHKEGLKYVPISIVIYTLLKILVVVL